MFRTSQRVDIFEWLMSSLLICVGLIILASPGAMAGSHMRMIVSSFSPTFFGMACLLVGSYRSWILTIHPINAHRFLGAVLGAGLWGEMVYAFGYRHWISGEPIPPGFVMLAWQLLGELWVATRLWR